MHFLQNPTLEHYTGYSVSQLKTVVLALHDLQLNTSASSLNAIRQKYKQPKVKMSLIVLLKLLDHTDILKIILINDIVWLIS